MRKRNMTERRFKCDICGYVATAYKKSNHRTSAKHIKHMYCPFCKTIQGFVQLSKYE